MMLYRAWLTRQIAMQVRRKSDFTKNHLQVKNEMARSSSNADGLMNNEFCCMFYGYKTRCATCILPKSLLDLFDDGTLDPEAFQVYGRQKDWQRAQNEHGNFFAMTQTVSYDWCLEILELTEKRPKKLSDLKKAFKAKALKLHPDVGGCAEAFRELVKAYEIGMEMFKQQRK